MTTILTKAKTTTGAPSASDLTIGDGSSTTGAELAVNTHDKKLYSKNSSNAVVEIAGALHAYPLGAIFISVSHATEAQVQTALGGGTWSVFGAGRALVSLDSTDTDFDAPEEERGSKTVTLSEDNLPAHDHKLVGDAQTASLLSSGTQSLAKRATDADSSDNHDYSLGSTSTAATLGKTSSVGSGTAVNNIQPSIVVYMWKRTG